MNETSHGSTPPQPYEVAYHTLAPLQAVLLALGALVLVGLWWRWIAPGRTRTWLRERFTDAPVADAPAALRNYLAPPVAFLTRVFLAAWLGWIAFYVLLTHLNALPQHSPRWEFFLNFSQTITTYTLVLLYFRLSAPRHRNITGWEQRRVLLVGWFFILLAITTYEFLLAFRQQVVVEDPASARKTFMVIYGFAQSLALFLVMGRLENVFMADHLRRSSPWKAHLFLVLVWTGYAYAAIQPLYPLFSEEQYTALFWLGLAAFLGKVCLAGLFTLLLAPLNKGLSPLEHYLYEIERFTIEELSLFELRFLKKHFGHLHRSRQRGSPIPSHLPHHHHPHKVAHHGGPDHGGTPGLGIEYSELNDFKRECLCLDQVDGGVWVRKVHPDPEGLRAQLLPGDYITHINGVPFGRNNRLLTLLTGAHVGDQVQLRVRRHDPATAPPSSVNAYTELDLTITLDDIDTIKDLDLEDEPPTIGCTFLHNSPDRGVVCRDGEKVDTITIVAVCSTQPPRFWPTPDVYMLRLVLSQFEPGDTVGLVIRHPDGSETIVPRPLGTPHN